MLFSVETGDRSADEDSTFAVLTAVADETGAERFSTQASAQLSLWAGLDALVNSGELLVSDGVYTFAVIMDPVETNETGGEANAKSAKLLHDFVKEKTTKAYLLGLVRPIALYKKRGTYERDRSHMLAKNLVIAAGRALGKPSITGEQVAWHAVYNDSTREMAMKMLRDTAEKDAASGKYDDLLPAKWRKGFQGYDKEKDGRDGQDEALVEAKRTAFDAVADAARNYISVLMASRSEYEKVIAAYGSDSAVAARDPRYLRAQSREDRASAALDKAIVILLRGRSELNKDYWTRALRPGTWATLAQYAAELPALRQRFDAADESLVESKALPTLAHLKKIGRATLMTATAVWDAMAMQHKGQWRLATKDDDWIRTPPRLPAFPHGYPYQFDTAKEAMQFGSDCVDKLDRASGGANESRVGGHFKLGVQVNKTLPVDGPKPTAAQLREVAKKLGATVKDVWVAWCHFRDPAAPYAPPPADESVTQCNSDDVIGTLVAALPADLLTEMSMMRIFKHFNDKDGFVLVSADRSERSPKENAQKADEMEQTLRSMGKGFVKVKGGFVETGAEGKKREVFEHSYFVPDVAQTDAIKFAAIACGPRFDQEAILWGNVFEGVYLINRGGSMTRVANSFKIGQASSYFTQWRKRNFEFANDPQPRRLAASVGMEESRMPMAVGTRVRYKENHEVTGTVTGSSKNGFTGKYRVLFKVDGPHGGTAEADKADLEVIANEETYIQYTPTGQLDAMAWEVELRQAVEIEEASPPGFSTSTKRMITRHGMPASKAYALSWAMYKRGAKPHHKPEKGKRGYVNPGLYFRKRRNVSKRKVRQ